MKHRKEDLATKFWIALESFFGCPITDDLLTKEETDEYHWTMYCENLAPLQIYFQDDLIMCKRLHLFLKLAMVWSSQTN